MADHTIEETINQLTNQIAILTNQLSKQNERLSSLEERVWQSQNGEPGVMDHVPGIHQETDQIRGLRKDSASPAGGGSSWAGSGSFLAKLATICFILVVALVLRTLTDSGIIDARTGSYIGTAYAAFLIAAGWKMIKARQGLGPIFPVCGALLMYALVMETHARFEAYTSLTAYTILLFTMLPLVILGKQHHRSLFNGVGLVGAACTAFAIDFPSPFFPMLALFLFAANIIAFSFENRQRRWPMALLYAMTILFWYAWAIKLHAPLVKGMETLPDVALSWFLPVTLVTVLTCMGFSIYTSFYKGDALTPFDLVLPTINVLWLYPACNLVILPWMGSDQWLGYAGLALSLVHFAVAGVIFRFSRQGGPGICAYVFAGATLMVMATGATVENILPALPLWGLVAVLLSLASQACEIGGIRLTSYLLQCVATVLGITYGAFLPGTDTPILALSITGALAVMSTFQYQWSRKHPINCSIGFFAKFDPQDRSAVVLLLVALVDGFCMMQLAAANLLASAADPLNALLGTQSVFINLGAIGLMIFGLLKKDREILYTAIGVVIIGGCKALGYDLFKAHGIPLVSSVFSFGAAAAVGSMVLSRWSQTCHEGGLPSH